MAGSIRPQCNQIIMSHYREAAYGTPLALDLINKRFNPREPIILNPTQEKVDDSGRIKGHEFPTDPFGSDFVVMRDLELPFSFDASLELLALLLSSAMGHDGNVDFGVPVLPAAPGNERAGATETVAVVVDANDARKGVATFSTADARNEALRKLLRITAGPKDYIVYSEGSMDTEALVLAVTGDAAALAATDAYTVFTPESYEHSLRAGDICVHDQFPSTTWVTGHSPYAPGVVGGVAHPESYILCEGVIVNDLSVGVSSKSWIDLTGTAYSNGRIDDLEALLGLSPADKVTRGIVGAFTPPTSESARNYLIGPNIEVGMWSYPSAVDDIDKLYAHAFFNADFVKNDEMTDLFRGFEFSIGNNLDTEDAHGNIAAAGIYLNSLRVGDRTYTLSITVEGHQGDPRWQAYAKDTVHRFDVRLPFGDPSLSSLTAAKNPRRYCTFSFPIVTIDTITTGFDGIRATLELSVKPFAHDLAGKAPSPVRITIENADQNYNYLAA